MRDGGRLAAAPATDSAVLLLVFMHRITVVVNVAGAPPPPPPTLPARTTTPTTDERMLAYYYLLPLEDVSYYLALAAYYLINTCWLLQTTYGSKLTNYQFTTKYYCSTSDVPHTTDYCTTIATRAHVISLTTLTTLTGFAAPTALSTLD